MHARSADTSGSLKALAEETNFGLKSRRSAKPQVFVDFTLAERFRSWNPCAEEREMSFIAWKILRRLPKPLVLVLVIFVLAARA